MMAKADAFAGQLDWAFHGGDVEELSVGFGAIPTGPERVKFAFVFERSHVDGPEIFVVVISSE